MSVSEFLCTALSVTELCRRVASLCATARFLRAPVRQSFQRWWRWGGDKMCLQPELLRQ